jgi:hypothetical protein
MSRSLSTLRRLALLAVCAAFGACTGGADSGDTGNAGATSSESLRLVDVFPHPSSGAIELNQTVTLWFNAPLDRRAVAESFRVVDADGERLTGRVEIGTRSIEFRPYPPTRSELDDGTFPPGGTVRFEVAGFPSAHALRTRDGALLERSSAVEFSILRADESRGDLPAPLLPSPALEQAPFELQAPAVPRIAGDDPRLVLGVSRPVLPTSLSSRAFVVHRVGAEGPETVVPASIRLLREVDPLTGLYGTQIELAFEPGDLAPGDLLYVQATDDVEHALRDYRGNPLGAAGALRPVAVHAGERVRLFELDFGRVEFVPARPDEVGFVARSGRAVAEVLAIAGDGADGSFHPVRDTVLEFGVPDPEAPAPEGTLRFGGHDAAFHHVEIPVGVQVTVRSRAPVVLRARGSVRIDGTLRLETPAERPPEFLVGGVDVDRILDLAGAALVAGADLEVGSRGQIVHERGDDAGTPESAPFELVCGGDLVLHGPIPLFSVVVLEPGSTIAGYLEESRHLRFELPRYPSETSDFRASAWTPWFRLGDGLAGRRIRIELEDPSGDVRVSCQTSAHDPLRDPAAIAFAGLEQPIRIDDGAPLTLPADRGFVRFLVEGEVRGGEPLPGIAGLRFVSD